MPGISQTNVTAAITAHDQFIELTDAPSSYVGEGTKIVAVNAGETALEFVAAGSGANTLDGAYDQGGAGVGRSITADTGAVLITASAASGNRALEVVSDDNTTEAATFSVTASNQSVISLNNTTNGLGSVTAELGDPDSAIGTFKYIRNLAAATTAGPVFLIDQQNAGDDQPTLTLKQAGSGVALSSEGDVRFTSGKSLQTSQSAGNTMLLQAYDVDGAAYTTFATLTANNTPTMVLSGDVTSTTQAPGDNSTKLATTAYADAAASGGSTLQAAFDAGQTITVANTDNQTLLLTQNDTTNNPDAFQIVNTANSNAFQISSSATGAEAILVNHTGGGGGGMRINVSSLTSGTGLYVESSSTDATSRQLVHINNISSLATGAKGLLVQQGSSADGVSVDQDGNGTAISVDSEATTAPAFILDIVDGDAHLRLVGDSGNATPTEGDFWRESDGLKYYDGTTEHNLIGTAVDANNILANQVFS